MKQDIEQKVLEVGVLITKNQELTAKLETLLKNHEKERDDWKKKEVELNNTVRTHLLVEADKVYRIFDHFIVDVFQRCCYCARPPLCKRLRDTLHKKLIEKFAFY